MGEYPAWICHGCGIKHGRLRDGCATYHIGSECGWCGRSDEPVTEPRDWGYPKALPTSGSGAGK